MCGIMGYIGKKNASGILLDGLKKLEYRGYDSAGIALINDSKIKVARCKGKLSALEKTGTIEAAKNVGESIAKKATKLNIRKIVFDRNGFIYHGRIKAVADAAREAGLEF